MHKLLVTLSLVMFLNSPTWADIPDEEHGFSDALKERIEECVAHNGTCPQEAGSEEYAVVAKPAIHHSRHKKH